MAKTKIKIKSLFKSFGHNHVLSGVDLDIAEGESLVVIGGSGTGKSVLIKCLLGLIIPDKGKIVVDGEDITYKKAVNRTQWMHKIGMLFQGSALFDSLKIWENIGFYLLLRGELSRKEAYKLALESLELVGLNERVANLMPSEISGGMQKRVALARAIAHRPQIMLFDEPTAGLDPVMSNTINCLIRDLCKGTSTTSITITHDMSTVKTVSDRVAMLKEGRIIWSGSTRQFKHCPNEEVNDFIHGIK